VTFKERTATAASVVALMGLGTQEGDRVSVRARGASADAALAAVVDALETATHEDKETSPARSRARAAAAPGASGLLGVTASPGLAVGRVVQTRSR